MSPEAMYDNTQFGQRKDGKTKGKGYLGVLRRPDGVVSTEISVGVDFGEGEMEIPTLVPGLSKKEIDHLLNDGKPTPEIMRKAVEHARKRIKDGKPVFADDADAMPPPTE